MDKKAKLAALEEMAKEPVKKISSHKDKEEEHEDKEEEYCCEYECPKCGTAVMATVELDTVECPCCGAEMDKSEEKE